ncbi:MAG: hypothetical protein AAGH89_01000 [Verrucomicrobiota bacterium]
MPEPEPMNEAERLATLQLLGEASEEERERLQALLDDDGELAGEQNGLEALTKRLQTAIPDEEFALPDNVLAALEQDRKEVLEEANALADPKKIIPFSRTQIVSFAIAAAVVFGLFLQFLPDGQNSNVMIASHAVALEMARNYPPIVSKGVTDTESLEHHRTLISHLDQLRESGDSEKLLEILDALPDSAQELPEFKRLRKEAIESAER